MAIFDSGIIQLEGGLTDDSADHGGLTKYGIDQASHPGVDIANLTVPQAVAIYEEQYWNPNNLGMIQDQNIANIIFTLIVNTGAHEAVEITQAAINSIGGGVEIDGVLGSITYNAINHINPLWLADAIRLSECRHYLAIVDADTSQEIFFRGWIRRALS